MNISVEPGDYVIAVSGGVDSMVLLDIVRQMPKLNIVVAHLDHGIRPDSVEDRLLVQSIAERQHLRFEYEEANLGPNTSEAEARKTRYLFLDKVKSKYKARAIITAHHQDDVIETAILNILRGTGRKGLTSLRSSADTLRPMTAIPKTDILAYAKAHKIMWREDSTNSDDRYMRNYVRHKIIPRLSAKQRQQFYDNIEQTAVINAKIDSLLHSILGDGEDRYVLDRQWFRQLPDDVAAEVMAEWLRGNGIRDFNRKMINRLVEFSLLAIPNKLADINALYRLRASKLNIKLERRHQS